ncbi:(bacterio)chlorophyll synthase [Candidatus Viridilinea mediisalina]|uniref:Bacteriochlorophyll/chlorophyll synthetase n=1 Tax=Candidatus Viridilinea mediisalina TaxID=2024553 RepID=A0A2A6RKR7_9CHLR|nr:(bacterio)chlorophyll synthase [Candidatus Viridilinea mediisalina]PDW03495.1 bacteriochlorophyll/chlorophyll synthetase [Candidatus Viridilinea mediisalina]
MDKRLAQPTAHPQTSFIQRIVAHIELADPITWISPITMVICGALAAGRGEPGFHANEWRDLGLLGLALLMCGPFGTGFSQSINDYYDRELDAINDPSRPIPSKRVTLFEARINWLLLGAGTLLLGLLLASQNLWILLITALSLIVAAAYSVPPIKLKQHYWFGPPAVGFGYVFLSWMLGHIIFAPLTWPSFLLALINSTLAAGLLFLNDIKSIEGDRKLGLQSMTVALGARRTLIISYLIIGICQLMLLLLALIAGHLWAIIVMVLALVVPLLSQIRLYREPNHRNFQIYILVSNPFVVFIQFASAFIVGGYLV